MPAALAVNGTTLDYDDTGSGPVVVLVHGFSLDQRCWEPQVAALAAHYRVVRYDLRGFGQSALPEPGVFYRHADDLWALLDALGIERAALVGLSLGGAVALDAARVRPERVWALVLADAVAPGFQMPNAMTGYVAAAKLAREGRLAEAREAWLASELFAPCLDGSPGAALVREIVGDYSGWGWTARDPGRFVEPPAIEALHEITAPALVLAGALDAPEMLACSELLAVGIEGARMETLPGCGHLPNLEDAEAFNAALLAFLAEVDGEG